MYLSGYRYAYVLLRLFGASLISNDFQRKSIVKMDNSFELQNASGCRDIQVNIGHSEHNDKKSTFYTQLCLIQTLGHGPKSLSCQVVANLVGQLSFDKIGKIMYY